MTITLTALAVIVASAGDGSQVDYLRDVKPMLEKRCYACHGALKHKADLRLDTAEFMRKGGRTGPAIEPGKADESLILDALRGDLGFVMPPEGEGLKPEEIETLRAWIDHGAVAPADEKPQADPREHWAYQAPRRPEVPSLADGSEISNPIDAFLANGYEKHGLKPVPEADRPTLLRRVTLDLTGLAPTRGELHEFLNDSSPDAYEKVVERLLASPRYGERWGRHWMDVWRYSDWYGFGAEVRHSQPHVWRWRDWIVESLNADKGYDRMVVEMLAGDEVAPGDDDTLRATGYLVRNWFKFNRHVWLQETVDHTAKAFLGVTLACARCHDHKYDPIDQDDYYRVRAFFEPHEIRTDRLPGQPDTNAVGLVRVYDAYPDRPTYPFERGDDRKPIESKPLEAALPGIFGGTLPIEAVPLPVEESYPGLKSYIQTEALAAAESRVKEAKAALEKARQTEDAARASFVRLTSKVGIAESALDETRAKLANAEAAALAAGKSLAAAEAGQIWEETRIEADKARFAQPPDSKQADILAIQAQHAERQANLLSAEAKVASTECELAEAQQSLKQAPDDAKAKKAAQEAEAKLGELRKALAETEKAAEGGVSTEYTRLTPVYPQSSTGRRLALARWITSRDNPLTARVAVNHIWMRHFGEPLVPTVFDFGMNGKAPTNPELLDWLACELMDHGWSMKHLHRLIVTSRAYRMRSWSEENDPNGVSDPRNVHLWRMNPRRMESEVVRDNVLFVTGGLDPALGGQELDQDKGLTTFRRSLYYRHAPEKMMTFLSLFDAANTNACYRRDVSIVPQQALALINSPLALSRSRVLAKTLTGEVGPDPSADGAFVQTAFEQVLSRVPNDDERSACLAYLNNQAARLVNQGDLTPFVGEPQAAVAPSTDPRQRAREGLIHVLINHNDFIEIR